MCHLVHSKALMQQVTNLLRATWESFAMLAVDVPSRVHYKSCCGLYDLLCQSFSIHQLHVCAGISSEHVL